MRAKDALEMSLTKLPGSVLALCCAEPLLRCMRCLCSFLGCTGAELISLVMVWLPPGTFSFVSFDFPAFGLQHSGSSELSLSGRGEGIEGLGTALLHVWFFFPTAEMESGRAKGPKPRIVTSVAGQACTAPASRCRLYPNQGKKYLL